MPKCVVDANPSNQWLANEPDNQLAQEAAAEGVVQLAEPPSLVPSPAAKKQEWADHAVSQGADPAEVAGLSKARLIEQYGGQ